jgi:ribosomal protein S18 acetylase RimI-like enzyme
VIRLRPARIADIDGLAGAARDVWGQEILPEVGKAQIEGGASVLWVATDDAGRGRGEEVVGFASAFLTMGASGQGRWEVDLIAVRRDHQGHGLGTALIRHVWRAGDTQGAALARALIRVENVASQRAFRNAGFTTDGQVTHLLLWTPRPDKRSIPDVEGVALLTVDTLTYRGLWIEGLERASTSEQRSIVGAARSIIAREQRLNTGAVVHTDKEHALATDLRTEARMHGEHYWFLKSYDRTIDSTGDDQVPQDTVYPSSSGVIL